MKIHTDLQRMTKKKSYHQEMEEMSNQDNWVKERMYTQEEEEEADREEGK